MSGSSYTVAALFPHPIQYFAPLFRAISATPDIRLKVYYLSDFSLRAFYDPGFARRIEWDVPLLDGYDSEILFPGRKPSAVDQVRMAARLVTQLARGGSEALWVHGYAKPMMAASIILAKRRHLPCFIHGDSSLSDADRSWRGRVLKRPILSHLLRQVTGAFTAGQANTEYYLHYGMARNRMFLMPYAVDNAFFRAHALRLRPCREEICRKHGLDPRRPIAVSVAKLIPSKRPHDLLAAAGRFKADRLRPQIVFVGDGSLRRELEQRAARENIQDVHFLGFLNQTELPEIYSVCDVLVQASQYEPWGLVVNEVMNFGKPVIASDRVGSARDLVQQGQTGFVYPAGDVDSLFKALQKVLGNAALGQALGARGQVRVEAQSYDAAITGLRQALAAGVA